MTGLVHGGSPHARAADALAQSVRRTSWLGTATVVAILAGIHVAEAHVKWFAPYDLTKPPLPVGEVLDGLFLKFFLGSVVTIYVFFWLDRYVMRWGILENELRRYTLSESTAFTVMRVAACVFFVFVAAYGLAGHAFFLTPELKTDQAWVPWLQLAIAACAIYRPTVPVVGVGMAILFGAAVAQYGVYHLLDYLILIGVAYYFAGAAMNGPGWIMSRYIVLYAATGLTLLWAAIEKWGYPFWTYPLLAREPGLAMGLENRTFMVLAGFVEFNLTFMLLSSASLISRAVAFGFGTIFALAIYKFGMIDAVGHLLIITILFVLAAYGPTKGRFFLVLADKSLWTEAYFMTGLYVLAFVLVFIAYYALHFLAYGN